MINPDIDEPVIVNQIVDAIRDRFAICYRQKVIDIDFGMFPLRLSPGSVVLELADRRRLSSSSSVLRCAASAKT